MKRERKFLGKGNLKKAVIGIMVSALLFGTMEVSLKIGGANLDPVQMTFLRFLIGGLILAPFAVPETRERMKKMAAEGKPCALRDAITGRDLFWMFLVGVVGISFSMLFFQLGVERCNAATAAPLMSTNPLFTMLIAHVFTSEKMHKLKWIAFVVGLAALIFMIRPWDVQEGNSVAGIVFMVIAAISFGVYNVMGKRTVGRIGVFTQTSISFFCGSIVLLIIMLLTHRPVIAGVLSNWAVVLYCGIMVTGVGYLFYFIGIKNSDATTGSLTFFIKPVIAPILAVLILHETVYWNTIVGIILLIIASVLTLIDQKRTQDRKV